MHQVAEVQERVEDVDGAGAVAEEGDVFEMEVLHQRLYNLCHGCEQKGIVSANWKRGKLPNHAFTLWLMSTGSVPPTPGLSGVISRTPRFLASSSA
jgi:hypothetical protein